MANIQAPPAHSHDFRQAYTEYVLSVVKYKYRVSHAVFIYKFVLSV